MGMFNVSVLQTYEAKWNLVNSEKLDTTGILSAKVVASDFGTSACFFLSNGKRSYMPMSINGTKLNVNDVIDLQRVTVETLHRDGQKDIYRCRID